MRVELEIAYVLHNRAWRDTSLIVEAFSREHGRMGLVARGARRARSGLASILQPFQPLLLSWSGSGELATLAKAEATTPLAPLTGRRLLAGLYLNELLTRLLQRHDPHPDLYAVYDWSVRALSEIAPPSLAEPAMQVRDVPEDNARDEIVLRVFEKRLLRELGYGLLLDHSAESGAAIEADAEYCYLPERGPVPGERLLPGGARISGASLLAIQAEDFHDARTRKHAKRLMRCVLRHYLGDKPLRSRELFNTNQFQPKPVDPKQEPKP